MCKFIRRVEALLWLVAVVAAKSSNFYASFISDIFCDRTKILHLLQESLYVTFNVVDILGQEHIEAILADKSTTVITLVAVPSPFMTEWHGRFAVLA